MSTKITLTCDREDIDAQIRYLITALEQGLKLDPAKCTIGIPKDAVLPTKYSLDKDNKIYGLDVFQVLGDKVELVGEFDIML